MNFSRHRSLKSSSSYKKSFVSDILKITGDHLPLSKSVVVKCHITGLVVGLKKYPQRTIYVVDDGTGVVDCIKWHSVSNILNRVKKLQKDLKSSSVSLSTDMKSCAQSLLSRAEQSLELQFDLGDTVSLLGGVKMYEGKPELNIQHFYKTTDPDYETLWMLDVMETKKSHG